MGRLSDSVPNLLYQWRSEVADADCARRMGGAVLEYRLVYHAYPRTGDTFEIYGAFDRAGEKTHSLVYWIVDPVTGRAWASSEAVAVALDLDTRKIINTQSEHIEKLKEIAPPGLKI